MTRRNRSAVAAAVAIAGFAALTAGAAAYAPGNPAVVSDVQAALDVYGTSQSPPIVAGSPIQPNTQIEPSIAVNPGDHNNVVTDFQVGRVDAGGDADNGFGTSLDGGLTWHWGNLPGLTKLAPTPVLTPALCTADPTTPQAFDRASDAVVTFGKDTTGAAHGGYFVYAQSLVFDDTTCNGLPSGMALNVSSDGGLTWSNALIVEADPAGGLNDKNWIVSDNQPANFDCPTPAPCHSPGRTYIVWDRVASIEVAYCDPDSPMSLLPGNVRGCDKIYNWSTVSGKTFQPLFGLQGIGAFPVVLNNGSAGMLFNSLTAQPCSAEEAPNSCPVGGGSNNWELIPGAGATPFGSTLAATTPIAVGSYQSSGVEFQRAGSLPQVAYDPVTGDLVAAWEDNRYRTDNAGSPGNQNDAVITVSTPVGGPSGVPGATWSVPARVNQDAPNDHVNHWNTMVAVGNDGIWRVGYRQRFEPIGMNPKAPFIDTYYQESRDQGATFTAPLKVNTAIATDPQFGAFSRNGLFVGDYQQLAAGGNDETYVTRDESFALPGGPTTCDTGASFNTIPTAPNCQNQTTFVAHLLPQTTGGQTPETRFVPALILVGAAAGAILWRNRRKRGLVS